MKQKIAISGMLAALLTFGLVFAGCPTEPGDTKTTDTTPPANVTALSAQAGNATVTLSWTKPSDSDFNGVEITWTPAGGTQPVTATKTETSKEITGLTNDSSAGYTFTVKSVDTSGNKSSGAIVSATPSATVYTVTFDANKPAGVTNEVEDLPDSITGVATGSTITKPADPSLEHYFFDGWYKEAATTDDWDFSTDTVTGAITLYAKWTEAAPVTAATATPGDQKVTLAWTDPVYSGNFSVVIVYADSAAGEDGLEAATPILVDKGVQTKEITGLTNGTTYNFIIVVLYGNITSAPEFLPATPTDGTTTDTVVTDLDLTGKITAPVKGQAPVTTAPAATSDPAQWISSAIAWTDEDENPLNGSDTFGPEAIYAATFTLTPETGFTFTGLTSDSFTFDDAEVAFVPSTGVVTITFPATAPNYITAVDLSEITAPETGVALVTDVDDTTEWGFVSLRWEKDSLGSWIEVDTTASPNAEASTTYRARVVLSAELGYNFTGLEDDDITVDISGSVDGVVDQEFVPGDKLSVMITFPATL